MNIKQFFSGRIRIAALLAALIPAAQFSLFTLAFSAHADDLPKIVRESKGSVLAVGTFAPLRNPQFRFAGTGFVIGDGLTLVTNAHVVPQTLDVPGKEVLAVARAKGGGGTDIESFTAEVMKIDRGDDLAVLKFKSDTPLPALRLAAPARLEEGTGIAMLGYPLGVTLGLIPAVHRGVVSALAPLAVPKINSQQVDARTIRRMRGDTENTIYQLDAVAYPGNSGSPLLSTATGEVVGIINAGLVKGTRESAATNPTGISYAVPVDSLHKLLGTPKS
jgi:serine protease Do